MGQQVAAARVDRAALRDQIQAKYTAVAREPERGFHFHTGRPLAAMLGYETADVDWLPAETVASFAGTGNPFALGGPAKRRSRCRPGLRSGLRHLPWPPDRSGRRVGSSPSI